MKNLFSVRIKWLDTASEADVLIAESNGVDDIPDGYTCEDVFFTVWGKQQYNAPY